jgi:arylsulfatase A-like enzyme
MSNSPEVFPPYRPNVILITFDSLAAQNMSLYGYDKVTTPHLDAFAKESFVFKNVFANCNSTIPSLISILTGRYPSSHNCHHVMSLFGAKERSENIASVLRKEGFHISAVLGTLIGHSIVSRLQFVKSAGWASGLKSHLLLWKEYLVGMFSNTSLFRWSREVTRRALRTNSSDSTFTKAVDRLRTLPSPFFLWIHIYPPHAPYLPSPKFKYAFLAERTLDTFKAQKHYLDRSYPRELQPVINKLRSRYDELILNTDDGFGTFWEAIKHQGYLRNSIVIVTSDHGEMFEKGYQGHDGTFLYQPLVHIPLILRMPNQHEGKVLAANAEHIDIAPTLLDILGLKIPSWMEGESLKKAMEQSPVRSKPKFSTSVDLFKNNGGPRTGSIAVTHEEYKLVFPLGKKGKELYDLSKDPKERTNLVHLKKEEARILEDMIRRRMPAPLERFDKALKCSKD